MAASARWLFLAAVAAALASPLAGCGGVGTSGAANVVVGNQLTVYSSLPFQGPSAAISQQIVNGEKLALGDAGGRAGAFKVGYDSTNDASPAAGRWDPGVTAANAKAAAQDTTAIAYLGDYDSGASALSLPFVNAAGILQISPASPYVGLTSSLDAGQDEPERFYPTGQRTFGRLLPGDAVQAAAQVKLMRELGVRRVYVLGDQDPFAMPLAQITAGDAEHAGIAVAGDDSLPTTTAAAGTSFAGEVAKIRSSGAQAVFLSASPTVGAVELWKQLHAADPHLLLLGSSALIEGGSFTAGIGPGAAASTYLTNPVLPIALYPPSAQRVLSDYRRRFGEEPGPYALDGYEAMSVVLDAIRQAGSHGGDRQAVIDRFFAIRNRDSVLGRYSILANGDTTLTTYAVDRVVGGAPVYWRTLSVN